MTERIEGYATPEGTAGLAARGRSTLGHGDGAYRLLGGTGLSVSALGFGGYRVSDGVAAHVEALRAALAGGINLIDTSTNYMEGGSEQLVGCALRAAIERGDVRRDEVVVVSKVGYVQGDALDAARRHAEAARPDGGSPDEMVRFAEDAWHCISPAFVRAQLQRTLERTSLARVDVYLLHNPEYYLTNAVAAADAEETLDVGALRASFEDRVRRAFEVLEEEVVAGTITSYGVSSNTLAGPIDDPTTVSLTALRRAADAAAAAVRGAGAASAFHVVQLPFNFLEDEAARRPNTAPSEAVERDGPVPVLEAARQAGLAVLVNRPLNAIQALGGRQRLIRLACGSTEPDVDVDGVVVRAIRWFAAAERTLSDIVRAHAPGVTLPLSSPWLARNWQDIETREDLGAIVERVLFPRAGDAVGRARSDVPESEADALEGAVRRLETALRRAVAALNAWADARAAAVLRPVQRNLDAGLPVRLRSEPLARKALWFAAATAGVTCVLNGMRRPDYVADALAVMGIGVSPR